MKPIQLISFNTNKQIVVNQEAVDWLMKTNQQKHIGIITVVGKYRTGKSYILNRVLLNQNSGFQVGPTINACTKGLWVWPQLIQNPNDPTIQYMVMDTEGLGSLQQGQQTDTKIFLMAMLLSSYFVYNSVGSIDQKAVQNLSLITNLSKLLQKGGDKEMQEIINCFPTFLWLVRDFALRLEDQTGKPLTPREYLQNALKTQKGTSDMVIRKNGIRKELTTFFKDRDCFMLIRPVDDEKKLQNMAQVKDSEIRPKFLELIKQLRTKVFLNIKKKTFKGKPCSPAMFVELCQYFCNSINKGGLPQIQNNWDLVCRSQSNRIQKRCVDDFKKILSTYEKMKPSDVDLKALEKDANDFSAKILKYFQKNAYGDKIEKKKAMKEVMMQMYQKLRKKVCSTKNQALDQVMNTINDQVYGMINQNLISSIFQVTERYDSIIEKESEGASEQTLSHLYKKCYEGLKTNAFTLFGSMLQTQSYQTGLLTEKLGFYQDSLNRIQDDNMKKTNQADTKQRQLKQSIFQLELKAKETLQQLQRAKKQLHMIDKQRKQNSNPQELQQIK